HRPRVASGPGGEDTFRESASTGGFISTISECRSSVGIDMRRVYDGNILVDWDAPPDAVVCPSGQKARRKWGWQQDERGRWYRLLEPGRRLQDPPSRHPKPRTIA